MILTHFATDKTFAEFDYAQLEIRVLALATKCKQLIQDINDGRDMHTVFAAEIFQKPEKEITQKERRIAKGFSFQLQYGAGAKGIAKFWNVDINLAETFINSYYERYPEVSEWQEGMLSKATKTLDHRGDKNKEGEGIPSYFLPTIWQCPETKQPLGYFRLLGEKPEWKNHYTISPTKVKNYAIQGGASDIMMFMLVKLQRALERYPTKVLNTVHDSVLLEIDDNLEEVATLTKQTLESVPEELQTEFSITSPIPFPVDYSFGKTLEEVKRNS